MSPLVRLTCVLGWCHIALLVQLIGDFYGSLKGSHNYWELFKCACCLLCMILNISDCLSLPASSQGVCRPDFTCCSSAAEQLLKENTLQHYQSFLHNRTRAILLPCMNSSLTGMTHTHTHTHHHAYRCDLVNTISVDHYQLLFAGVNEQVYILLCFQNHRTHF